MSAPSRSSDAFAAFAIDRSSPIPLWFQVAQHFERSIAAGDLPQGTLLDNEIVLAERLGISRPTMRRAMEQLVDQGLIVRRRGIGTRVVQPKVRRPLELTSLHDDLASTGQQPSTTVLRFEIVGGRRGGGRPAAAHRGGPRRPDRAARSAREQPIARMTNWLPADIVTFEADGPRAPRASTTCSGAPGCTCTRRRRPSARAPRPPPRPASSDEPRGAALLTMERETLDDHGTVVEFASHLYAASRYSFEINLVRG